MLLGCFGKLLVDGVVAVVCGVLLGVIFFFAVVTNAPHPTKFDESSTRAPKYLKSTQYVK